MRKTPYFARFAALLLAASGMAVAEQVIISEVHYHPRLGGVEFIEFTNLTATVFDIAQWRVSDGVDYTFPAFAAGDPEASFLKPFERIVLSPVDEATFRTSYPSLPTTTRVFGPWLGALSNGGERIALEDKNGVVMAEVSYNDDGRKWPVAADGGGHSLRLARPNRGASDWRNWAASSAPGGTPGEEDNGPVDISGGLRLSEVHFALDGTVDWVELFNASQAALSLDGLFLASALDFTDKVALSGSLAAGAYLVTDLGFPQNIDGDVLVFLIDSSDTVLAGERYPVRLGVESYQSDPPGGESYGGAGHTRAAANVPVRNTDIVINEIMYDLPSDSRRGEFVELYNRGASAVDVGGWRFVDGVNFEIPTGTQIASGGYLVVAADPAWITAQYGAVPVVGPFSGNLRDSGELLRLEDSAGNLADEVDYKPSGDWPELADGDGSSMELRHPEMDNDSPSAWADSDESAKAAFETFTYVADFEQATWQAQTSGQELHMHLVGDAHLAVRNVVFGETAGGSNILSNPTVMSPNYDSSAGWVAQGTHWASYVDNGELHLVADGHGDNKANRAEVDLANLSYNTNYTLTFEGRWVSGNPRLIAQTIDHGFGTSFRLPIPNDLGTPGAANSRLLASAAPTVSGAVHSPAVPSTSDPVTVTARVGSSAALGSVELVHRESTTAGDNAWSRTAMHDDGSSGGDEVAGDGLYTVTVTSYQTQNKIVEFYVEAMSGGQSTSNPKLGADRPAMWICDSRTMPSTLARERFIISLRDRNALSAAGFSAAYDWNFPKMSNHFFNATFIHNESEVFYNAEIRKSGSPFTRDEQSRLWHGKWKLPDDRLFRERHRSVFDPSGVSGESNSTPRFYDDRIARYMLYLLGHPTNEMEYVHWVVNGDGFKLRENHEPISNDFLNRNWPDGSSGTLCRIDDEWRYINDSDPSSRPEDRNADWSYKNSDNPVRYHSEWLMRTREEDHDYSNFVEFVRAVGTNSFDEEEIDRMADHDLLCLNAAVRGYNADWDTITMRRGKNAYFFRPKETGRWMLIHWDGDRVFGDANDTILGSLPGIPNYFGKPYIRRVMNYYLTELLTQHTKGSARTETWMDLESAAVSGTGITMAKSHYTSWFNDRESTAQSFIGAARTAAFDITTSNAPVSAATIDLAGTAPSAVHDVRVAGQPAVRANWTSTTEWQLAGVVLQAGANTITIEGVNHEGLVIHSDTFNITKTGDSPPVMALAAQPASFNVSEAEQLSLDAGGSFDPESSTLAFTWAAAPSTEVTLTPSGAAAAATFAKPGLYEISVTGRDAAASESVATRQAAVYGSGGFSNFSDTDLDAFFNTANIDPINGVSTGAWYSLETYPGRLHVHIPPERAYPIGIPPGERSTQTYLQLGDTWAYRDDDVDLMAVFADLDYDDSAWPTGGGLFGDDGTSTIPAPGINTPLDENIPDHVTYYLRTEFEFDADPEDSLVVLRGVLDDGVRIWLNGQLLHSENMPEGPITHTTTSDGGFSPERELVDFDSYDGSSFLRTGTNVIAADLHNQGHGSSDIMFGLEMYITANALVAGSLDATTHPWVRRELPASGDWVLQTDLELAGIQFGDFMAGLMVEVDDGGTRSRYGVGYRDGDQMAVVNVSSAGNLSTIATTAYAASNDAVVRISRVGDELIFSWRPAESFVEVGRVTLAGGTDAIFGGPFAATEMPETLNVLFDYVMLIDPGSSSPVAGDLLVTEVMYKPVGGDLFEYLELHNAGPVDIDLTGYRFPQGDPFDEYVFGNVTIPAGGYLLVVHDLGSFQSRYGHGFDSIIGGDWVGGSLSNGGETITLLDAGGQTVLSFEYDDVAPWPTSPDTDGTSLTLVDPATGSTANGADWAASSEVGGSPGSSEAGPFVDWMSARGQSDALATQPGAPLNNLLTYAFGVDLADGDLIVSMPAVGVAEVGVQSFLTFEYRRRMIDPSVGYLIQSSVDGVSWSPAGADLVEIDVVPEGDGTERVSLRAVAPLAPGNEVLLRVQVTAP